MLAILSQCCHSNGLGVAVVEHKGVCVHVRACFAIDIEQVHKHPLIYSTILQPYYSNRHKRAFFRYCCQLFYKKLRKEFLV